jgi:hypothetical protein
MFVWEYIAAVFSTWWGDLAAVSLLLRWAPQAFPSSNNIVVWFNNERKWFIRMAAVLFICANFQLFRTDQQTIASLQNNNIAGMDISKLPTSFEGLKPGTVWNNGGVLSIVQP